MPKPAAIEPNKHLNTTLPPDLRTKMDLLLWSPSEGRVPRAAYQKFLTERLNEYFANKSLDLAPYLGSLPGELTVQGNEHTLTRLANHLKGVSS